MKILLLLGSSVAFSLFLVEIALRIAGISYPVFTIIDPHRGFAMAPGAEGWQEREGRVHIKINRDGLRDQEHPIDKPEGTIRIAVLGDSYAQAFQVPMEDAFWWVLGDKLASCPGLKNRQVEVINFGVGGYGTAQELLTLRQHVWKYDPDIVMLAFLTGNDITDNSSALRNNPTVPYFVLKDGELVLDDSFLTPTFKFKLDVKYGEISRLLNSLRIFQLVKEARRALSTWGEAPGEAAQNPLARGNVPEGLEDGLDHAIYAPPPNEAWDRAWRVTEALILAMAEEVHRRGADFWLVTLSNGIQVHPDPEVRQAFMDWKGVKDLFYPDSRLRKLAEDNGIPVVTLAEPLAAYAEAHDSYLHGFETNLGKGHWNATGHLVAGREIAARMCRSPSPTMMSTQ